MEGCRRALAWAGAAAVLIAQVSVAAWACFAAYKIRMYSIEKFGTIIHEFDPWFNVRAAQYLADHGVERFFKWFDHMSWYPLGRPVGSTIYPGMQLTAVALWAFLRDYMPATKIPVSPEVRKPLARIL